MGGGIGGGGEEEGRGRAVGQMKGAIQALLRGGQFCVSRSRLTVLARMTSGFTPRSEAVRSYGKDGSTRSRLVHFADKNS